MAIVEAETQKTRGSEGRVNVAARKRRFLRAVAEGSSVLAASRKAGRNPRTFYRWRDEDEAFADRWREADLLGTERLAGEVRDRALDRQDDKSHLLLMFELKRRDPAYRDSHQVEINHSGTVEHEHKVVSASAVLHILQDAEGFDGFEAPGLAGPGGALPSTRELLAAHPDTEAGSVPPASSS